MALLAWTEARHIVTPAMPDRPSSDRPRRRSAIGIHSSKIWTQVLIIALVLSGCRREPIPIDVVIVAGQSNAVGCDADPDLLNTDPHDKEVLFWWRCGDPPPDDHDSNSGSSWTYLQPQPKGDPLPLDSNLRHWGNFSHDKGGFGPEVGLARTMVGLRRSHIAIVKVAYSGTGLHRDWNPRDHGPSGACYRSLIGESRKAIKALQLKGYMPTLLAIAWVQGENDCTIKDADKYQERMTEFIADLRSDIDAPGLFVLMGFNGRFAAPGYPSVKTVIAAQKNVARKLTHCIYVETDGATLMNSYHFDAAGNLEVGRRFALALLSAEDAQSAESGNAPQ
jgi:hypothetical protein